MRSGIRSHRHAKLWTPRKPRQAAPWDLELPSLGRARAVVIATMLSVQLRKRERRFVFRTSNLAVASSIASEVAS